MKRRIITFIILLIILLLFCSSCEVSKDITTIGADRAPITYKISNNRIIKEIKSNKKYWEKNFKKFGIDRTTTKKPFPSPEDNNKQCNQ